MKYINTIRNLVVASFLGVSSVASAQDLVQPPKYGALTATGGSNFYKDYVGVRFQICGPSAIAGDKVFTTANIDGTGTWAGRDTTMICKDIKFAPAGDTDACSSTAFPSGYFNGKVALVWRGTCEFGCKAQKAQAAGADAVVIVNNVDGGPVGMAGGSCGAGVTIPVYMISLRDGLDIINQIHSGATVTMTVILNWNDAHNNNDLGFVPAGYSIGPNYAMPWNQINANPANSAYAMKNGAYVANYGLHNQTGVRLKSDLTWTPTGVSATAVRSDSVVKGAFPAADSIWAMFMPKYSLPTTLTGSGKFDLKYTISSDSTDAFLGDNSYTYSFYATDSLYSKGRYDFNTKKPYSTFYTGPGTYTTDPHIWSVPYYVAVGGSYAKEVQFSVIYNLGTGVPLGLIGPGEYMTIYLFKWTDATADSFMENNELQLVGKGRYDFLSTDSSFRTYTCAIKDTNGNPAAIPLAANSWYLVAAQMNPNFLLGLDGVISGLPRTYGLKHFNNVNEYYNPIWAGDRESSVNSGGTPTNMFANPTLAYNPYAFDGSGAYTVDSVDYSSQRGLIPALPLIATTHPVAVANVKSVFNKLELYPNPATNTVNVTIGLDKPAKQVMYTVIDATGKYIAREVHNNVTNDVFTYNTSNLANGSYYMIVDADDKTSSRKFVVMK